MKTRNNRIPALTQALAALVLGLCFNQTATAQVTNWANTGPLNTARSCHTATLLPNGQVLVAGG